MSVPVQVSTKTAIHINAPRSVPNWATASHTIARVTLYDFAYVWVVGDGSACERHLWRRVREVHGYFERGHEQPACVCYYVKMTLNAIFVKLHGLSSRVFKRMVVLMFACAYTSICCVFVWHMCV